MTLRSTVISLILFKSVLICGDISIYLLFKPYFIPDVLHIGFAITIVVFCISWIILWIVWIDKRIDKKDCT